MSNAKLSERQRTILSLLLNTTQGMSQQELRDHMPPVNGIPQSIQSLRRVHGFEGLLVTDSIKPEGATPFGRYRLTEAGRAKARALLSAKGVHHAA